jgi:hypothetical protein
MLTQQVEAELAHKLKALEDQRHQKLWMAQRWREYAQRNLEHTYASQVQQAQDEYDFERQELLDRLIGGGAASNKGKGGRQGQRGAANGAAGADGNGGANRMVTRTSSRRRTRQQASAEASMMDGGGDHGDRANNAQLQAKLRKLNPPLISYTLTDDEIVEDLSIICNRVGAFSSDMKKTMFQEALGYPPAPTLPPPNNYPAPSPPSSTGQSGSPSSLSPSSSSSFASSTLPTNTTDPFSPSTSPPRTSAFAHKLTTPHQRDPFAAPS